MSLSQERALVLFSAGQDSTTCLAWALENFAQVETIGFAYGQRHEAELSQRPVVLSAIRLIRPAWADRLKDDRVLDLDVLGQISETALTRDSEIKLGADGLPTTFVPGRNLVFLSLAGAVAYRRDIRHLVAGMCETDYSGYPDCRDDTIKAMQLALNQGLRRRFVVHTPLMWLTKAATWALAEELGGAALVRLIVEETHSCYLGERSAVHEWGKGCGTCPACVLRARGWREYRSASSGAALARA
jgi:7-cyano-7-deazaguanine synthase